MRKSALAILALAAASTVANAAQPSGNLNGAIVSISSPLTGTANVSNGEIKYTGTGAPAILGPGSSLNGVTFVGGGNLTATAGSGYSIINCTLPGFSVPTGTACNNVTITGNHFSGTGYDDIDCNPCGNNWAITGNVFPLLGNFGAGQGVEAIHLTNGTVTGLNISNNTITGSCRNPIEVQVQAINGICSGNYIHKTNLQSGVQASIGISWACGPSAVNGGTPAPGASFSTNCQITGNVIDNGDGAYPVPITNAWSQVQGIEYMGNGGTVANNWIRNAGFNAYTWTNGFTSKNNAWIGYTGPQPWNSEQGETNPIAPTISGDKNYTLANAPAMPAAGAPGATTPAGSPVSPVGPTTTTSTTLPANPAGVLKLTQNGDGSVTIVSPTAVSQVAISPTTPSATAPVVTLAVNPPASTVTVGHIPASWNIQVAANGLQATTQVLGGPASVNNGWASQQPAIISTNAATQPTTHTITIPATQPGVTLTHANLYWSNGSYSTTQPTE